MVSKSFIVAIMTISMLLGAQVWAEEPAGKAYESAEAFLHSLNLREGIVELPDGIATLNVPDTFRYIGPDDAKRFLEEGWGNPDGSGQIGMLLPMQTDLFGDAGWAVVIRYEEDGYVSDKDAGEINYDELLQTMQASTLENNKARAEEGFPPVTLVGWAAPPRYDNQAKKLYWAKELQFGQDASHTLNYNVRILGRKGVLVLNAVSGMEHLPVVRESMEQVIAFAEFKDGHRYSDFNPGVDKVAAYGIAALVGGKVAAKIGLLAKMGGLLLAFKKLIIIGLAVIGGLLAKLFKRRKAETYS